MDMNDKHTGIKAEAPFSLWLFIITIIGSVSLYLGTLAFVAPTVWKIQLASSKSALGYTFVVFNLINSFGEFFLHRYVLHAPLIPFLSYFYKQHTLHHALTRIVQKKVDGTIENKYPILEEIQHTASFFPWYTFLAFAGLATPVFIIGEWLFPTAPIFLGGVLAIAWSLVLYEVLHAIEHWPLETWAPLLNHPRWGKYWRLAYCFHLRHHADIKSNEAISGFLIGIPVADIVFGTWKRTQTLYENGVEAVKEEFQSPRPRFINWLDDLAEKSKKRRATVAS